MNDNEKVQCSKCGIWLRAWETHTCQNGETKEDVMLRALQSITRADEVGIFCLSDAMFVAQSALAKIERM